MKHNSVLKTLLNPLTNTLLTTIAASTLLFGCTQQPEETVVVLETTLGDIELLLYEDTPLHKANFIDKVESGYWNGRTFNRVISNFMIQCGYEQTENTVEPEIHFPKYIHTRGILGMGRSREDLLSNSEQFYIEWGKTFDDATLDRTQERLDRETNGTVKLTDEIRETYKTTAGSPHLDGQFTIFGEVRSGLDVVEAIQAVPTDSTDTPLTDVTIIKAYIKK